MTSDVPPKIEGWAIGPLLGEGAFGHTYLATRVHDDRRAAVKVSRRAGRELAGRFEAEARAVARLVTAHTPALLDSGQLDDGRPYLVFEWVDGRALRDTLESRGRLSPADAVDVAKAIAECLANAHAAGLLHRDIKPSNVLVPVNEDSSLRFADAYLLDFGLAGTLADHGHRSGMLTTSGGELVGSPLYMSPEQASGRPLTTHADIWGVGVLLYEMLVGHPPFQGETLPQVLIGVLSNEPEFPSPLPHALEALIRDCLSKDYRERPPDGASLLARLERLDGERATGAFLPSKNEPAAASDPSESHQPAALRQIWPERRDGLELLVVFTAGFLFATYLGAEVETPAIDVILALASAGLGVAAAALHQECCTRDALRPAEALPGLQQRAGKLMDTTGILTESLAIDFDDLLEFCRENGANALEASMAIMLHREYKKALDENRPDAAIRQLHPLLGHMNTLTPWWIRQRLMIGRALTVGGIVIALLLVARAAAIARMD